MVKYKNVQAYKEDSIPDHILEEIYQTAEELMKTIEPILEKHSPNIAFASFSVLHAYIIMLYISNEPDDLRRATKATITALARNIEKMSGFDIIEGIDNC